MSNPTELLSHLRNHILGHLHVGLLQAGDRLPSIRETARESGVDHRAVAAAYRTLEEEGLVEVRPNSGVYVSEGVQGVEAPLPSTGVWIRSVYSGALNRRIPLPDLAALLERFDPGHLTCGLVESVEDIARAIRAEIERDLGIGIRWIEIDGSAPPSTREVEAARDCDLLACTAFHRAESEALGAELGVEVVTLTIDRDFAAEVSRRMRERRIVGVSVDPRYAIRAGRHLATTDHDGRFRFVLADEISNLADVALADDEELMATYAARELLGSEDVYHLLPPPWRLVSRESLDDILRISVSLLAEHA